MKKSKSLSLTMRIRPFCMFMTAGLLSSAAVYSQDQPIDSAVMRKYEAHATAVTGQVSRVRDDLPWAVSAGEHVSIQQKITTGPDGYAHFEVGGGSSFDLFGNSRVIFRQNAASAGDLLDVFSGRVRIHLQPTLDQPQQRVFCPVAIITAHVPTTLALAIDEDDTVRIDVIEGEIRVEHTHHPTNDPVVVRAVDAILVQKDQAISRRVDRGSLYRYTVKPLKEVLSAIAPGLAGSSNLAEAIHFKQRWTSCSR